MDFCFSQMQVVFICSSKFISPQLDQSTINIVRVSPLLSKLFILSSFEFYSFWCMQVEEQKDPDPEFSTVTFPNPEEVHIYIYIYTDIYIYRYIYIYRERERERFCLIPFNFCLTLQLFFVTRLLIHCIIITTIVVLSFL